MTLQFKYSVQNFFKSKWTVPLMLKKHFLRRFRKLYKYVFLGVRHFPKSIFTSGNFPSENFPSVNFPSGKTSQRLGLTWWGCRSMHDQAAMGGSAAARTDLGSWHLENCTFGKLILRKLLSPLGKFLWENT